MTELRECPFCGGKATGYPNSWAVKCESCNIQRYGLSYADAIERWNTRYEPTCRMDSVKSGPLYDVYRCSRCGYGYAENRCDPGMKTGTMDGERCPNCGSLIEEVTE